MKSCITSCWL